MALHQFLTSTIQPLLEEFLSLTPSNKLLYGSTAFVSSYVLLYMPIRFIYRLYFDPLSGIPGPKSALVSENWNKLYWIVIPWKKGTEPFAIKEWHDRYGPIVRTGPRHVSFNDIEVYNQIYRVNTKFPKSLDFYNHPSANESIVETVDIKDAHARRAAFAPYFSKPAVRKLEDLIQSKVSLFLSRIQEIGTNINITRGFRCLTVDIITSYSYEESFESLSHPTFTPGWLLGFEQLIDTTAVQNYLPNTFAVMEFIFENLPRSLVLTISPVMGEVLNFKDVCSAAVLGQKSKYLAGERNMVTIFAQLFEDDEKRGRKALTDKQLIHDALSTIAAGMDTTGHALSYAVYYLVKYPEVQRRLLEELKGVMGSPRAEVKEGVLDGLPFLQACIKESLRFSHGVPGPLPRDVPAGGATLLGHHLPAGTVLLNSAYTYHTNPAAFPNPSKWDPTRWLVGDTREMERHFIPFSRGSRICIGMHLAEAELSLALGRFVRRFEVGFMEGFEESDMEWRSVFVPKTRGMLMIWAKEREE
ncbi:uncharacterized protein DFL_004291 [Arthrobotrys flagrans]|uniref:Cytochrome P450 n=1 Tax=Arthrobotrys flagrans TaxID=97331 RepID=A0A437A4E3_ARTFL|nr:hypothetical protein DFL_004291 [Arthrobotrys flagrans]